MKVLFVVPEIRLNDKPYEFPFWAGILGAIVDKKGGQVAVLDLNATRMDHGGNLVPNEIIESNVLQEKWDLIGIGGLTTTYGRIKELVPFLRRLCPDATIVAGGGWSTYNPDEILHLIPEIDIIVIGEGEETFSELYDKMDKGGKDFQKIKGLCIKQKDNAIFTEPRALIPDLNIIPYPNYELYELEIYFRYSSFPYSIEAFNSKRRASVVWERGCPRGCTFCSHNGMSRIDLQNIYGKGDRRKGEVIARQIDKENDTFQLPARWPSAEYAVNNVKFLKEKYDIDFVTIEDENMTSNRKWTEEFCNLYVKEGLHETVKWGTLGDAPSVSTQPNLVKIMKESGCTYISFGFESASNKVLKEDIQKGQTQLDLHKTISALKAVELRPHATFMIGNAHENIDDILETVSFWARYKIEVDPFICTPYVGSPIFYNNKDFILEQYDERLKLAKNNNIDENLIKEWKFEALDKFMTECGDATLYTATVSQYFTIPELIALKRFMYKQDLRRIFQMAHQKLEQTGAPQWEHSEKWNTYCPVCLAYNEITPKIEIKKK